MIRVLIVDDHPMVRAGLRTVLNDTEGIIVVGECTDGDQVAAAVAEVRPDVVLMEWQMPAMTGTTATRNLVASHPTVKVVMMSASEGSIALLEAIAAGASGYLVKNGDPAFLVAAVRAASAGEYVWPGRGSHCEG